MTSRFNRRRFLEIAGLGTTGLVALRSGLFGSDARASPTNPQLLLFAYFSGGWDQLLTLDPRPNNEPKYQKTSAYAQGGTGIYPAYDIIQDAGVAGVLGANPSGVQSAGALTFGPAVPQSLMAHNADLCIVRGVRMDTLTHEVGRRYFLTGKFPRGLAANGSSLNTVVAGLDGSAKDVPNLAVGVESYNEGWPAFASPIRANSYNDMLTVLRQLGVPLSAATDAQLKEFEATDDSCEAHGYNGKGLVDLFRASRQKARTMTNSTASSYFKFANVTNPGPEVKPLFDVLGITTQRDLTGPKGKAAVAAQALVKGISQSVAVELANDLDDHFDWDVNHAPSLRGSLDVLGNLISFLKAQQFGTTGQSVWSHTTMVVFSEFARTPLVNGRTGRDHHLASSCLVAGPGIKGNLVVGATSDKQMAARTMNLTTGQPDDVTGAPVRPADVHATVLESMGLTYDHLSNQSPKLIQAILKG
jgi:uncharacterized protein (DUF1501 family)